MQTCYIGDERGEEISKSKQEKEILINNELRYKIFLEKSLEGVCEIDKNGITTFASYRMGKILGYAPEEMIGKSYMDFMDEDGRKKAKKLFERRKRRISETHDFCFKHKTGKDTLVLLSTFPYFKDNKFLGGVAYITDITDRIKSENSLRESELLYRTLFEQSPDTIVIIDTKTNKPIKVQ